MKTRSLNRRELLASACGTAALVCGTKLVSAQGPDTVRVGYLHVLSVDAHLWLGTHLGSWERENLRIEPREFTTGIELFQALVGGSLDVLTTGGVLSNFPARGQGKVFLINDLEYATGQDLGASQAGHSHAQGPQGPADRHHPRDHRARPAASGAQERRSRFDQGRGDR